MDKLVVANLLEQLSQAQLGLAQLKALNQIANAKVAEQEIEISALVAQLDEYQLDDEEAELEGETA